MTKVQTVSNRATNFGSVLCPPQICAVLPQLLSLYTEAIREHSSSPSSLYQSNRFFRPSQLSNAAFVMATGRRATRSASSSALFSNPVTTPHNRRPSRIPLSLSTNQLPHTTVPLPSSPTKQTHKHIGILLARLVTEVDSFITRRPRRKRTIDRPLIAAVCALFFVLFLSLFLLIKRFFGAPSAISTIAPHSRQDNIRRISQQLPPLEYWPLGKPTTRPKPRPIIPDASDPDILAYRARPPSSSRFSLFPKSPLPNPAVTLIAACRDRTGFLQTALPTWRTALRSTDEILLVDWGTQSPDHVPIEEVVRATNDPRISIITVAEPGPWVLSRAYNLAIRHARGDMILKVDCDTMVNALFLDRHPLPGKDSYYRFHWIHAKDDNEQHLNGVFFAPAAAIRAVNGYDERITTYGWDDEDLYGRLEKILHPLDLRGDSISHISHGDDLRGANQHLVMGPTLETQINSQAAEELPSWSTIGEAQKTVFRLDILSRDGRFLAASVRQTPVSLLEQLPEKDRELIVSKATDRLLHDVYGFPWGVLAEINRSRAELVKSLARLGRSTHWRSGNGFIFAEVGGTVPERILGIASAIGLARTYERPLFLAWSSGSREDPTPRVTDFFDVDGTDILPGSDATAARIYQIGRWRCRSAVSVCAGMDPAFNLMTEFRTGGHADEIRASQAILDVLRGKVSGKRNVLLRLEGAFPQQTSGDIEAALTSLRPSFPLRTYIDKLGDMSSHLGVYVGRGVRAKGVDAMVRRLESHAKSGSTYFVTGPSQEIVDLARHSLPTSAEVTTASKIEPESSTRELRETIREIGEIFALATCRSMVNDGRAPAALLQLVSVLKENG